MKQTWRPPVAMKNEINNCSNTKYITSFMTSIEYNHYLVLVSLDDVFCSPNLNNNTTVCGLYNIAHFSKVRKPNFLFDLENFTQVSEKCFKCQNTINE